MLQTLVDSLDYLMNAAFFGVIAVSLILYFDTKAKRWGAVAVYFVLQAVLEIIIRTTEVHNSFTIWLNHAFGELTAVKGFFYSLLIFDMVLVVCYTLDLTVKKSYFLVPALICFLLVVDTMVQEKNMIFYGIYFVPCELFYIGWSIFGLKKIKEKDDASSYRVFRMVMIVMIIATLIMLVEDIWSSWHYGLYNTFLGCTDPGDPHAYIKARSYSESILQIVLAGFAFYAGASAIAKRRASVPCGEESGSLEEKVLETGSSEPESEEKVPEKEESEPAPEENVLEEENAESPQEKKRVRFADDFALSAREKEVFFMLLDNYSIQEISDALTISSGTVKYHTHNIYQKARVGDRVSLILKVDAYYHV